MLRGLLLVTWVGWLVVICWVGCSSIVSSSKYVDWFGLVSSVVTRNIEGSMASLLEFMWWERVSSAIVC